MVMVMRKKYVYDRCHVDLYVHIIFDMSICMFVVFLLLHRWRVSQKKTWRKGPTLVDCKTTNPQNATGHSICKARSPPVAAQSFTSLDIL